MPLRFIVLMGMLVSAANAVDAIMADEPTDDSAAMFAGVRLVNEDAPFLSGAILGKKSAKYTEGELITLTFQAEVDVRLYVLYHQTDGTTLLLYPNRESGDKAIPAETKFTFPPPKGNYRFRVQAPFGKEVLQLLATTTPIPELDGLLDPNKKAAPVVSKEVIDQLAERLLNDLSTWSEHRILIETIAQ